MAYFAVSYQLNKQQDYPKIWAELERLDGHKVMNSFYFLDLNNTALEVKNHLADFLDKDDQLCVVPMDSRPSVKMAYEGTNAWLAARF